MDKYSYIVLTQEDCMEMESVHSQTAPGVISFSSDKLNALLSQYGEDGYRLITQFDNSPYGWVLVLSKQLAHKPPLGRFGG